MREMSIVSVEDDGYVASDKHWSVSWLPVTAHCIAIITVITCV